MIWLPTVEARVFLIEGVVWNLDLFLFGVFFFTLEVPMTKGPFQPIPVRFMISFRIWIFLGFRMIVWVDLDHHFYLLKSANLHVNLCPPHQSHHPWERIPFWRPYLVIVMLSNILFFSRPYFLGCWLLGRPLDFHEIYRPLIGKKECKCFFVSWRLSMNSVVRNRCSKSLKKFSPRFQYQWESKVPTPKLTHPYNKAFLSDS